MKEVAISTFKAKCLGLLEEVRKTKRPLRVTRFGIAVAEVIPPSVSTQSKGWLGCMEGTAKITGDIVGSVSEEADWEASR